MHTHSSILMNSDLLERMFGPHSDPARTKMEAMEPSPRSQPRRHLECLKPGITFDGSQQSRDNRYSVQVEIKDVNLADSFLCGYLTINGLTPEYPSLTTYFEAEVIGPKHSFITRKWEAKHSDDMNHWVCTSFLYVIYNQF